MLTSPLKIEKRRIFINFALLQIALFITDSFDWFKKKKAAAKSSKKQPKINFNRQHTEDCVCVQKTFIKTYLAKSNKSSKARTRRKFDCDTEIVITVSYTFFRFNKNKKTFFSFAPQERVYYNYWKSPPTTLYKQNNSSEYYASEIRNNA